MTHAAAQNLTQTLQAATGTESFQFRIAANDTRDETQYMSDAVDVREVERSHALRAVTVKTRPEYWRRVIRQQQQQ